MTIPDTLLPAGLLIVAHLGWLTVLLLAVRSAPWRQFHANRLLNVFLGAVAALLLLWSFAASVTPGLGFHFLGATAFTLMFGWSFGVLGVSLAALGTALSSGELAALSCNALLFGVWPVTISYGVYWTVHRYLPHHIFIYIFLNAFFGGIIAAGSAIAALVAVLALTETYPFARIAEEYLPFLPLYLFPEGLLNGMLTTAFVAMRPEWLKTFDDNLYLKP